MGLVRQQKMNELYSAKAQAQLAQEMAEREAIRKEKRAKQREVIEDVSY